MPLPDPNQDPNWAVQLNDYILAVEATAVDAEADAVAAQAAAVAAQATADAAVPQTRTITAGTGLTGGGALSANRTISASVGTTAGTLAAGDDSRIVAAVPSTRTVSAGTGLTGGGDLSANRTLTVAYGTTSTTATVGNDTRVANAVQTTRLVSAGTGLTGGGDLSADRTLTVAYGTTSTTATVGNDTRVTGAYQSTGGTVTGALDVNGQALGQWNPRNHNLIAWSYDPAVVTNGAAITNGTVYLVGVEVNRSTTAVSIRWGLNSAAISPVANQSFVGLYNSAGTRLATVDVTAKTTVSGVYSETISVAVTPGLYWIGMVFNAVTQPQPYRAGGLDGGLTNVGLSVSVARYATNGTSATSLPSTITPASNSNHHIAWWVALG